MCQSESRLHFPKTETESTESSVAWCVFQKAHTESGTTWTLVQRCATLHVARRCGCSTLGARCDLQQLHVDDFRLEQTRRSGDWQKEAKFISFVFKDRLVVHVSTCRSGLPCVSISQHSSGDVALGSFRRWGHMDAGRRTQHAAACDILPPPCGSLWQPRGKGINMMVRRDAMT